MKTLVAAATCLTLLVLSSVPVMAQVAAPTLTPGGNAAAGVGSVPVNPAVMPWDDRSHVAAGLLQSKGTETDLITTAETDTELDGQNVGLRLAFPALVLAADVVDADGTVQSGTTTIAVKGQAVALAIPIGSAFSLGVTRSEFDVRLENSAARLALDSVESLAGATLRLGSSFYLGASLGEVETTQSFALLPAAPVVLTVKRDVRNFGVGIRTDGATQWHLEAFRSERDLRDAPLAGNAVAKEQNTVVVLEALVSQAWLIGVAKTDGQSEVPGSGNGVRNEDSTRVLLGFVPRPGWGLSLFHSATTEEDNATRNETASTAVSLLLQF